MFHTGLSHRQRRLLAADASRAVSDDGAVLQLIAMRGERGREVRELGEAPIERAVERTMFQLEGVARVEHDEFAAVVVVALIEPARQRRRIDRRRAAGSRLHLRLVHADDLALDLDAQKAKRLLLAPALLGVECGKSPVFAQLRKPAAQRTLFTGEEQVDTLVRQDHRAAQARSLRRAVK